ncbi:surface-adhesin E family protein [Moraxella oblonga]|uniref:surface-adhesin E family protein n=1 Tax=Moraxella oblonga TaxID=200413 RepID=UPI00082EDF14|nr:surface-adhesin E family protein [Moraxella oblonga]
MKKCLFIALLLTTPAWAGDWVYLGETKDYKHYLDKDSIHIKRFADGEQYVSAWIREDFKTAKKSASGKTYWQNKILFHFDCANQKWDFSHLMHYDQQGNVATNKTNPISFRSSRAWQNVAPDTAGETKFTITCRLVALNK